MAIFQCSYPEAPTTLQLCLSSLQLSGHHRTPHVNPSILRRYYRIYSPDAVTTSQSELSTFLQQPVTPIAGTSFSDRDNLAYGGCFLTALTPFRIHFRMQAVFQVACCAFNELAAEAKIYP
jgi:hypothetical protein